MKATAHKGPQGGIQYRLWTTADTYTVVGKYKALPHMTIEEKEAASSLEAELKQAKSAKVQDDASWRSFMRNGSK